MLTTKGANSFSEFRLRTSPQKFLSRPTVLKTEDEPILQSGHEWVMDRRNYARSGGTRHKLGRLAGFFSNIHVHDTSHLAFLLRPANRLQFLIMGRSGIVVKFGTRLTEAKQHLQMTVLSICTYEHILVVQLIQCRLVAFVRSVSSRAV